MEQVSATPGEGVDLVWRPLAGSDAPAPRPRDPVAQQSSLFLPLSIKQGLRILIDPASDLFGGETAEASIDLVHALIAVAHWHAFSLVSGSEARMRAYYDDPETPPRIAEEIDLLALSTLGSSRRRGGDRLFSLWAGGFARVRYGAPPSGGIEICPLSPDPWPLANLSLGIATAPLVANENPFPGG